MKKWIAIMCCVVALVCCLNGCGSAPDIAEPLLESTVPTEDTQDDEITVYPADMDVFYSLESFLDYVSIAESGGGLADLASLEYFWLPTGIPEEYHLYQITAGSQDIGFWYVPEDVTDRNGFLGAESRREHFLFISPRVHYSWFTGDETMLTWQEDSDLLILYLPKDFAVDDREALCQTEKFFRNSDGRFVNEAGEDAYSFVD